jgi:hypothetical protein
VLVAYSQQGVSILNKYELIEVPLTIIFGGQKMRLGVSWHNINLFATADQKCYIDIQEIRNAGILNST